MPTPASPSDRPRPARLRGLAWASLVLGVLAVSGVVAVQAWQSRAARESTSLAEAHERIAALESRFAALRADQRAQVQRLQHADATNRVLRDELLGIAQRAAIVEDSVARLADPRQNGAQALRLDEAELLLSLGAQRLAVAGDLAGAQRAYAFADAALAGLADPTYLSLRQTIAQERAELDAVRVDARAQALARLDALARQVASIPDAAPPRPAAHAPWWERMAGRLVQVERSERALVAHPGERAALRAAVQLELSLARAAAERRDRNGVREASARAAEGIARLLPPGASRARLDTELAAVAQLPLSPALPNLGSTLAQLRQLRAAP